jgi:hypothetical protein
MTETKEKAAVFGMVQVCQYPTCKQPANDGPCCGSRHGLALKQLRGATTDPNVFGANWRHGMFGANVVGDRYEDMIFVTRGGQLGI